MLDPEALTVARAAREGVANAAESDIPPDDRGLHLDRALDIYAQALSVLFGEEWRRFAVPAHGNLLETRVQRGY